MVIMDLEDAVAPDAKAGARAQAVAALAAGGYGNRELVLRVNGADTDWGADDLAAAATSAAHAVLLPKVERPEQIAAAAAVLPTDKGIWAMVETPRGVLNVDVVAQSSDRLECLVAGTSDLTTDLHARHTPDRAPMLASLSMILLAARASGLTALDGVYLDIKDGDSFRAVCEQGRTLGFDGKTLIHPSQVEPCNEVFGPSEAEVDWARRAIAAYEEAMGSGSGLAVLDGKLVENLHVAEARRTLARAGMIAN